MEFFEDGGLEPRFRARLTDFRRSGYDRGHLVRAACGALHGYSAPAPCMASQR